MSCPHFPPLGPPKFREVTYPALLVQLENQFEDQQIRWTRFDHVEFLTTLGKLIDTIGKPSATKPFSLGLRWLRNNIARFIELTDGEDPRKFLRGHLQNPCLGEIFAMPELLELISQCERTGFVQEVLACWTPQGSEWILGLEAVGVNVAGFTSEHTLTSLMDVGYDVFSRLSLRRQAVLLRKVKYEGLPCSTLLAARLAVGYNRIESFEVLSPYTLRDEGSKTRTSISEYLEILGHLTDSAVSTAIEQSYRTELETNDHVIGTITEVDYHSRRLGRRLSQLGVVHGLERTVYVQSPDLDRKLSLGDEVIFSVAGKSAVASSTYLIDKPFTPLPSRPQ